MEAGALRVIWIHNSYHLSIWLSSSPAYWAVVWLSSWRELHFLSLPEECSVNMVWWCSSHTKVCTHTHRLVTDWNKELGLMCHTELYITTIKHNWALKLSWGSVRHLMMFFYLYITNVNTFSFWFFWWQFLHFFLWTASLNGAVRSAQATADFLTGEVCVSRQSPWWERQTGLPNDPPPISFKELCLLKASLLLNARVSRAF